MINHRLSLQMLSVLLIYPRTPGWSENLTDLYSLAREEGLTVILPVIQALMAQDIEVLERVYVDAFDFSEATCLYLTAHEYGNRSERGEALLIVGNLLNQAQWQPTEGELPDYLPVLFEFLAQVPEEIDVQQLTTRVGSVCHKIFEGLDPLSPYRLVFEYACKILPCEAVDGSLPNKPPDVEDLPYPLIYD
jgi:nitrate reductase delta subunit